MGAKRRRGGRRSDRWEKKREERKKRKRDGSFFFNDTATTEIYTLSLHDALPIYLAIGLMMANYCHNKLTITSNEDGFIDDLYSKLILAPKKSGIIEKITKLFRIKKDRKSTRLNSSHTDISRMPSSA